MFLHRHGSNQIPVNLRFGNTREYNNGNAHTKHGGILAFLRISRKYFSRNFYVRLKIPKEISDKMFRTENCSENVFFYSFRNSAQFAENFTKCFAAISETSKMCIFRNFMFFSKICKTSENNSV